jgi:excisionase family DNA binding protein
MIRDGEPRHLTTGEAAKLLGVQPDTVLKWVKKGWLNASTTAGGHHRVEASEIEKMLKTHRAIAPRRMPVSDHPLRCWEYFSKGGILEDACAACVVHRVRAAFCFEMVRLGTEPQPCGKFSGSSCEECPYYQRVHGMAARILVITSDKGLINQLSLHERPELALSFASNPYSASTAVGAFRPGFVVVDLDPAESHWQQLLHSLANDSRIPGVRLFLARSALAGETPVGGVGDIAGMVEKPFGLDDLSALVEAVRVEAV